MIKEVTQYIEDKGLGPPWEIGVNLFGGELPLRNKDGDPVPERLLAVLNNAGGDVDYYLPDKIDLSIQLYNRAKSYYVAYYDAKELYDELQGSAGWDLPAVDIANEYCMVIEAVAYPAVIANPDEKTGLYIFSTNYVWRLENPT